MSGAVAIELVGEAVQDEAVTRVYGSIPLGGEASAHVSPFSKATSPLVRDLEMSIAVGYNRRGGFLVDESGAPSQVATWIWYVPITVAGGPRWTFGKVDLGVAAGPSWVVWGEKPGSQDAGYGGTKPGLLAEVNLRVDPRVFVVGTGPPPTMMRIEAGVGWRWQWPGSACGWDCGLDFGAPRISLGVVAVLK